MGRQKEAHKSKGRSVGATGEGSSGRCVGGGGGGAHVSFHFVVYKFACVRGVKAWTRASSPEQPSEKWLGQEEWTQIRAHHIRSTSSSKHKQRKRKQTGLPLRDHTLHTRIHTHTHTHTQHKCQQADHNAAEITTPYENKRTAHPKTHMSSATLCMPSRSQNILCAHVLTPPEAAVKSTAQDALEGPDEVVPRDRPPGSLRTTRH